MQVPFNRISLLEMLSVYAESFVRVAHLSGQMTGVLAALGSEEGLNDPLPSDSRARFLEMLKEMQLALEKIELHCTEDQIERMIRLVSSGDCSTRAFTELFEALNDRLHDELKRAIFLKIEAQELRFYDQHGELFGQKLVDAFPATRPELEEAGKCFACDRNTGAVFHAQRALEVGLKALAAHLGQPFQRNSGDAHLKDIERDLTKRYTLAGTRSAQESFYAETATMFGHVKTAWRNPTSHVDKSYTDTQAREILEAVGSLLRYLADGGIKSVKSVE